MNSIPTSSDALYRDLWLSEMWRTVPQYKPSPPEPAPPPPAVVRRTRAQSNRMVCPFCQQSYQRGSMPRHLSAVHSAQYEDVA